jgi:predicted kinase
LVLIVVAGLPAAGKTTLAGDLGRALRCTVIGVDPVEAAIWRAGIDGGAWPLAQVRISNSS